MVRSLRSFLAWLGGHGNLVLAAMLAIVGGTWAFVHILDEVKKHRTSEQRFKISTAADFAEPSETVTNEPDRIPCQTEAVRRERESHLR